MCGRFSQSMTREEYLSLLANEADRNMALLQIVGGDKLIIPFC